MANPGLKPIHAIYISLSQPCQTIFLCPFTVCIPLTNQAILPFSVHVLYLCHCPMSAFLTMSIYYTHATDHYVSLSLNVYLLHTCHWPPCQPFFKCLFTTHMPLTTCQPSFKSLFTTHMPLTTCQPSFKCLFTTHMPLTNMSAFL